MGDSACLFVHALPCQDSGSGLDVPRVNVSHHPGAFAESVSFGRFATESLAWERWSPFSRDRYMEDVSKFSTPGSVAEKKAYFEAHYKRVAAARKENAAASNSEVLTQEDEVDQPESQCQVEEANSNIRAENSAAFDSIFVETKQSGLEAVAQDVNKEVVEDGGQKKPEEVEMVASHQCSAPAQTSNASLGEGVANVTYEDSIAIEDDSDPVQKPEPTKELVVEVCSTSIKDTSEKVKRPKLSVLRSSISRITSKLLPSSSKQSTPTLPKQDNCVTPGGKYSSRDTLEKKRSVSRTLHMSINSSPWSTSKTSASGKYSSRDTLEKKRSVSRTLHVSINSSPWSTSKTSASASKKRPPPIPEKSRVSDFGRVSSGTSLSISSHQKAKTPTSVSVNRSLKLPLATPPTDNISCARTSTSLYNARPPTVPVPFNFKCDERAAKRREIPPTLPRNPTPKLVEKSSCSVVASRSQPPPRPPIKTVPSNNSKQKSIRVGIRIHENISPNIQS